MLENVCLCPFWGVLVGRMGNRKTFCSFILLRMQQSGIYILQIKQHKNRFSGLVSGRDQNLGSLKGEKTENHDCESDISHLCRDAPTKAIGLNFGVRGQPVSYCRRNHHGAIKQHKNRFSGLVSRRVQNLGKKGKKTKNHLWVHPTQEAAKNIFI